MIIYRLSLRFYTLKNRKHEVNYTQSESSGEEKKTELVCSSHLVLEVVVCDVDGWFPRLLEDHEILPAQRDKIQREEEDTERRRRRRRHDDSSTSS